MLNEEKKEFTYELIRVPGVFYPAKTLLIINNTPVCFANSKKSLEKYITYAFNKTIEMPDKKIMKKIDTILGRDSDGKNTKKSSTEL